MDTYPIQNIRHNEATFFVSYDNIDVYTNKSNPLYKIKGDFYRENIIPNGQENEYQWDEKLSQQNMDSFKDTFCEKILKKYKTMRRIDQKITRTRRLLLSSHTFNIILEDNNWNFAVKIRRTTKESTPKQKQQIKSITKNIRDILLEIVPVIYIRTGNWTGDPITAETAREQDKEQRAVKKAYKEKMAKLEEQIVTEVTTDGTPNIQTIPSAFDDIPLEYSDSTTNAG